MVDYLTDEHKAGTLKQLADNMWNVQTFCTEELNAFNATVTHGVISFPYKINVLGTRILSVATATTGFTINLTDGTNAVATALASSSSHKYQKADVSYEKDTKIHIQSDAVTGVTAGAARFMFFYIIDERKDI